MYSFLHWYVWKLFLDIYYEYSILCLKLDVTFSGLPHSFSEIIDFFIPTSRFSSGKTGAQHMIFDRFCKPWLHPILQIVLDSSLFPFRVSTSIYPLQRAPPPTRRRRSCPRLPASSPVRSEQRSPRVPPAATSIQSGSFLILCPKVGSGLGPSLAKESGWG
jgi:hypothetical protein